MNGVSVLAVGDSPSMVFFAWRLQSTSDYDITVAWDSKYHSASITSEKFGSGNMFKPSRVFDNRDLTTITTPVKSGTPKRQKVTSGVTETTNGIKNYLADPLSDDYLDSNPRVSSGYDVIIISLSSRDQLNKVMESLHNVIVPKHTLILVDSSGGQTSVQFLLQQQFSSNPVQAWITDAPLCQTPKMRHPFQIVHSGQNTSTWIEPLAHEFETFQPRLTHVVETLGKAQVDTRIVASQKFIQFQWERAIPFIAFQPLSIIFDTPDLERLSQLEIAKPLYRGVFAEAVRIANREGACLASDFNLQYLIDNLSLNCITPTTTKSRSIPSSSSSLSAASSNSSSASVATHSTSPSSFQHCDSPLLYYNYYHWLTTPIDMVLLQPILQAREFGVKTPYLECMYGFMSQLVKIEKSGLFQRRVGGPDEVSGGGGGVVSSATAAAAAASGAGGGSHGSTPLAIGSYNSSSHTSTNFTKGHKQAHSINNSNNNNNNSTNNNSKFVNGSISGPYSGMSQVDTSITNGGASAGAGAGIGPGNGTGDSHRRLKNLQAREDAILRREQALMSREQELIQSRQPYPTGQVPMSGQNRPKMRPSSTAPQLQRHHGRPPSHLPAPHQHGQGLPPAPLQPIPPRSQPATPPREQEIDMMSLTARRTRRSVSYGNSASSLRGYPSQSQLPSMSSRRPSMSAGSMYHQPPPATPQPFSQQFELDDIAELSSSRYGQIPINSRRMSTANSIRPSAPSSRTNSFTNLHQQYQQQYPQKVQQQQPVQHQLPTPQVSETNLLETFSSPSPTSTPMKHTKRSSSSSSSNEHEKGYQYHHQPQQQQPSPQQYRRPSPPQHYYPQAPPPGTRVAAAGPVQH